MAKFELKLPQMGESVAEATLTAWLKEVGDTIEMDEAVFEIATDKVNEVRKALLEWDQIFSVTQLGLHLRVLIPDSVKGAEEKIISCVEQFDASASVKAVEANLEDVFVAVTEKQKEAQ